MVEEKVKSGESLEEVMPALAEELIAKAARGE